MKLLLDSSAIVAVILKEPGWEILRDRIDTSELLAVCAATLLETHMLLTNRMGVDALPILEAFAKEIGAQIVPFEETHWRMAAEAFIRFGKGRHPASLNFGDCIAYATSRATRMPLLFKGADFPLTDIGLSG